jgi:hypothetical protein
MTRLLEKAIEAARQLSPEEQDELARTIIDIIDVDSQTHALSSEERAAIERSRRAVTRGEFATEEQVAGVLSKYGT